MAHRPNVGRQTVTALPTSPRPDVAGRPAARASFAESLAGADSEADAERRRGLQRMKVVALSFLVGATIIFLFCTWAQSHGARRMGRLRPCRRGGRHGRRDGRLVRGHRAVQTPAGHPDPAHRDHQAQEGPARRGPRRVRPGELHVAGGRGDQAARRPGGGPARQMALGAVARRAGGRRGLNRAACAGRDAARRGRSGTCWTG